MRFSSCRGRWQFNEKIQKTAETNPLCRDSTVPPEDAEDCRDSPGAVLDRNVEIQEFKRHLNLTGPVHSTRLSISLLWYNTEDHPSSR